MGNCGLTLCTLHRKCGLNAQFLGYSARAHTRIIVPDGEQVIAAMQDGMAVISYVKYYLFTNRTNPSARSRINPTSSPYNNTTRHPPGLRKNPPTPRASIFTCWAYAAGGWA